MSTNHDFDPGGDGREPLQDVLARVSTELLDVAELIERLEPAMSTGRSTEFLKSVEHMRVMQGIDLAVQKARGLAGFLDMIGSDATSHNLIDITTALNLVTLEDMKRRLRASLHPEHSVDVYQKASGDFEFF